MKYLFATLMICFTIGQTAQAQGQNPQLEELATFGKSQPIGMSVSSDNRVFVSFPHREPYSMGLAELKAGERKPFPNAAWNAVKGAENSFFVNVQDIYVDTNDHLWVLDSKPSSAGSIFGKGTDDAKEGRFRLYGFNLKMDKEYKSYDFKGLDKMKSGLNDVRIDTDKGLAYLSDPGQSAIVVLDLKSGETRTVLKDSRYTKADPELVLKYEGREMRDANGTPFRSNVNGIALTKDNKWFYFKPINATRLYRIATEYLANSRLSDADLVEKVQDMGEVGITHGLLADVQGNIYLTNSMDYAIRRLTPKGKLELVVQDKRLLWPDSMGIGSDGYLYFSCAQLQNLPNWNQGTDRVQYPFAVYRIKLL